MSVLIFLLVLFVLVLVHELGHFAVAKWTGMRVDEFGIGFPPKLFGIKRGETEYTFNLFPVGGFVKMAGEDGDGTPSARLAEGVSELGEGKNPASGQSRYEKDGDRDGEDGQGRLFSQKSKWAQSAVLVAGVAMNILFAWFLVTVAFSLGVDTGVTKEEATEAARLTVTNVLPGSPAEKGGLSHSAVIKGVEANGENLSPLSPETFSEFVETHREDTLTILYTQEGEVRIAQIKPEKGIIATDGERFAVGVGLALIEKVERPFFTALTDAGVYVLTGLRDIAVGLVSFIKDAIIGKADFTQVAGPVGIVGLVGEASAFGITALLMFSAFISLNLAVINILPFPALDGGRLLFVLIEAVKGSPIPHRYAGVLNTAGFFLLILLMVAVTWNDIARLLG